MRMPRIHIDELPQRCRRSYDRFLQYLAELPDHFLGKESGYIIGRWDADRMIQPSPEDFVAVARKEPSDTGRKLWRLRFADRVHLPETFRQFPDLRGVHLEGHVPRPRRKPEALQYVTPSQPSLEWADGGNSLVEAAIQQSGKSRAAWVQEALLAQARFELRHSAPR
ncbi:MAG: hypothetical protein ACLFPR_08745 [Desulfococcaceae bacterium]